MENKEFLISSPQEMQTIAQEISNKATKIAGNRAVICLLYGDLGAGKTTLVKEIAKIFLITQILISPTFLIMKNYMVGLSKSPFVNLVHIDAYRLKNQDEMKIMRFGEILANKDNIVFIEWPENIHGYDFSGAIVVEIRHLGDNKRQVIIKE